LRDRAGCAMMDADIIKSSRGTGPVTLRQPCWLV
jgi:hypothetical protein